MCKVKQPKKRMCYIKNYKLKGSIDGMDRKERKEKMQKYGRRKSALKTKMAAFICTLLCMLNLAAGFTGTVFAAQNNTTPIDFVLILDCSGSMDESDEEGLSVSAAKMFVDMLPAENARLAVIAMGPNYGEAAYPMEGLLSEEQKGGAGQNCVKEAYPLQNITDQDAKQEAKETIDQITAEGAQADSNQSQTPIGYALQAAVDVLQKNGTEADSASIILLSDGRVTGEAEESTYNESYDYTTIDESEQDAVANGWPIYCLELNYDNGNTENGSWTGRVGLYQMQKIAEKTDGERITLNSPTEAQNAFSNIFAKFFEADPTTASGMIEDGLVSLDFEIDEMVAETNITLTGNINEVTEIVIRNADGKEYSYQKTTVDDNRIITYDNKENKRYITAKLLTPKEGTWSITAKGTDGIEIGLYAVSIREMNLQLNAQTDRLESGSNEVALPKGATVDFTASYIYNNSPYSSERFYKESTAYLYVAETGEKIQMTGSNDNYSGTITFDKSGEYTVKALVESDKFRNEQKESGSYIFTVGNLPLTLAGSIDDVELNVGGTLDIDCTQYFKNEDNDVVTYKVLVDQTSDISHTVSETGIMTIKAGTKAGNYPFTISANDGGMDQDIEQNFNVSVVNQPLKQTGSDKAELLFSYNADSLPKFILNACGIDTNSSAKLVWSDYFNDPDGLPVQTSVEVTEDDGKIQLEQSEDGLYVSADGKGKAVYSVTVSDCSDPSVSYTLTVKAKSLSATEMVWQKIKVTVFIILAVLLLIIILLIYAFAGRKIYGTWDVITSEKTLQKRRLGVTGGGKHAKCSLNRLLKDLGVNGDFPGVELAAGNNINKKVIIKGFGKVNEVMVNGNRVTDPAKLKKLSVSIPRGKSITLISANGTKIKLERKA